MWQNQWSALINVPSASIYENICGYWRNRHLCVLVKKYIKYSRVDGVQKQVTELCVNWSICGTKCERPTFSYWLPLTLTGLWKWNSFNGNSWDVNIKNHTWLQFLVYTEAVFMSFRKIVWTNFQQFFSKCNTCQNFLKRTVLSCFGLTHCRHEPTPYII